MQTCLICSKSYILKPSKSKYCSISCSNVSRTGKGITTANCNQCGIFFTQKTNKSKYCSITCSNKSRTGKSGKPHSEEEKERARQRIMKRYEAGWLPKAGRCKKISYNSPIAGLVQLDGTWELTVAEFLDRQKYNWKRNTERFPYICPKGKNRHYTPDFWVEELGGFVEVKGYETELDRAKWKYFPNKLTVLRKEHINKITNGALSILVDSGAC